MIYIIDKATGERANMIEEMLYIQDNIVLQYDAEYKAMVDMSYKYEIHVESDVRAREEVEKRMEENKSDYDFEEEWIAEIKNTELEWVLKKDGEGK